MVSTTSTVLVPGWRCTASTMPGVPENQLMRRVSSTESVTEAISDRRTGEPFFQATMSGR